MEIHIETAQEPAVVLRHMQPYIDRAYITMYGDAAEAGKGDPELFSGLRGRLWVAYADSTPIGIAGWTRLAELGYDVVPFLDPSSVVELKRLFVVPDFRGIGITDLLDQYRLFDIFTRGYQLAVGETGPAQLASKAVHSKAPYGQVPPFGDFQDNEGSSFFGVTAEDWQVHLSSRMKRMSTTMQLWNEPAGSGCER